MRRTFLLLFAAALMGCPDETDLPPTDAGTPTDAAKDAPSLFDAANPNPFCQLPGSYQWTPTGPVVVPGGPPSPDLGYLKVPIGFCVHYFGNVGNARQVRFAPGGELFVASPTSATTSGGPHGQAAIVILPDDDHDGYADTQIVFLSNLPSTQGLLFTSDYFYYQDDTRILRRPYKAGERTPSPSIEQVIDITFYKSGIHWPKVLDQADDGTIYVANGGDQGEQCMPGHPFHGGVLKIDGSPQGLQVAKGMRNAIGVRCARGKNQCFAVELSKDYSAQSGGREKLVPIRQGDDWGFPCCATKDLPYDDVFPVPDCSTVVSDEDSFFIGDTPFGLDFGPVDWPAPWNNRVFVPLHGAAGNWAGARMVAIPMNPDTGLPLPASNITGVPTDTMGDFASGWDDGSFAHGRPTAITFSPDGRLFLTNDTTGDIVWIAPIEM